MVPLFLVGLDRLAPVTDRAALYRVVIVLAIAAHFAKSRYELVELVLLRIRGGYAESLRSAHSFRPFCSAGGGLTSIITYQLPTAPHN
jgi:hypothetical protein